MVVVTEESTIIVVDQQQTPQHSIAIVTISLEIATSPKAAVGIEHCYQIVLRYC